MGRKRLIDHDPVTGEQIWHYYDDLTDTTIIQSVQDCEPVLGRNQDIRNYGVGGAKGLNEYSQKGIKNNMWHVASIPNGVITEWKMKYGIDVFNKHQTKEVLKMLEKPEWAYLRTGTGKLV